MLYPFSALLARMKYITRWSLMHSTRAESLSEHTCDTALLAHLLCLIAKHYTGTPCHHLGAAGRAGVPPRDEAEGMGQQGSVAGVLAEGFRAGGVHQTPPGDVLHPRQKGAERV